MNGAISSQPSQSFMFRPISQSDDDYGIGLVALTPFPDLFTYAKDLLL
jgi:hypothetical protein